MKGKYCVEGITGFRGHRAAEPELQSTSEFLKHVYGFLIPYRGKLMEQSFELTGRSFYFVKLSLQQQECYILLNAFKPAAAFARTVEPFRIEFMDWKGETESLSQHYELLGKRELEESISLSYAGGLNEAERKMVNYWKPTRLGDLIFNYWD